MHNKKHVGRFLKSQGKKLRLTISIETVYTVTRHPTVAISRSNTITSVPSRQAPQNTTSSISYKESLVLSKQTRCKQTGAASLYPSDTGFFFSGQQVARNNGARQLSHDSSTTSYTKSHLGNTKYLITTRKLPEY